MGLVPLVTLTLTVHVLYCHVTPTPPCSCPRWWSWHAPSFPVCPMSLPVFPYLPVVPVLTATLLSAMSNVWWMPIMPHSPDALLRINPCNPISNWWVLCKTVSINYWVLYLYFMEHFFLDTWYKQNMLNDIIHKFIVSINYGVYEKGFFFLTHVPFPSEA